MRLQYRTSHPTPKDNKETDGLARAHASQLLLSAYWRWE